MTAAVDGPGGWRRSSQRVVIALTALLATALLAYVAALRWIAEAWWLTTLLLYAPHAVALLPLGALIVMTAVLGPRKLLLVDLALLAVLLFPIMGLRVGGPSAPTPGAARLRLLSFNAASGARAPAAMAAEIAAAKPDVVVLQESNTEVNAVVAAALPGFAKRESTQFFLASRWPIHVFHEPGELTIGGHQRSPRFVYATLGSPLGPLDVFILHPISPRDALDDARALAREPGQAAGVRRTTADNTALRRLQVRTAAALAAASKNPVILAGDTNLPGSSALLAELLERWQDGFDAVGRGFGYTFPVGRRGAWMRIDRILASRQLRFLTFAVGRGRGSDHRAVWADLELRAAPAPRSTPGGATSTAPSARDAATAQ